jgi:hypothetical protein
MLDNEKRDMHKLQKAEILFLKSVRRYTGLDKIRNGYIGKQLRVFSINDRIRR